MIESRCGVRCDQCGRKETVNCKGCAQMEAPFWGGTCGVKTCCEEKNLAHCGECEQFPCGMLADMGKDQGFDPAPKLDQCREWAAQSIEIAPGTKEDIDGLAAFYGEVCDHLEMRSVINYPGWKKEVYPVREDAEAGVESGTLYTAKLHGRIVGSIILNQEPEKEPERGSWLTDVPDSEVYVIHTYAVHPAYTGRGIGRALLGFAERKAEEDGVKSIRLDVYEKNEPAIQLYEKCGYRYIDTVDLGLSCYGLNRFRLYEKVMQDGKESVR